ncbi:D-aminoacylase [Geodia barretti]|uniref:D-aminoacylase n=1 Tax=Geodia barretti TaxID=519541 RepID=A0AA35RU55_GEOBA|nr:D-aminoacylase [Geodia barretti]
MMADYDIIIRGGTIVDGTRTPRYVSDIAIKDGRIAKIGGLNGGAADRVIDAKDLIVAPGFVDLHTHYDAQIFWDPYCTLSGWHGVTSVALGNCGFGFAPSRVEDQDRAMLSMTRNEAIPYDAMKEGMPWNWVTFPDFIDALTNTPKGINCLTYVPLTPLYAWVMGWDEAKKRRPTEEELQEMVLGETSVQRDYDGTPMITDMLSEHEVLTFAKILHDRDEGFIELAYQETGEEGRPLGEETRNFFERVAEVSGRPVLYQAVAPNAVHPEQHRERIRWLESCAERGLRVYGQGATRRGGFELTFEDWNLFDDTPMWREGKHVIDALLDMCVEDDLATEFYADSQGRDQAQFTAEVLDSNHIVAGVSDGGAHVKFLTAGIYPTDMLTWLVRDEKVITLEDAHYKLSYLPAHFGGFKDRGALREGAPADVIIYDLEKLEVLPSEVAEDLPGGEWRRIQKAKGYRYTMVNGEITFEDGEPTGAFPGRLLRNGRG